MTDSTTLPYEPLKSDSEPEELVPYLFLVFQAAQPLASSVRYRLANLDEVRIGRGRECRAQIEVVEGRLVLDIRMRDQTVSSTHARLFCKNSRWALEDEGSKNGIIVNGVRCAKATLGDRDVIEIGKSFFLFRAAIPSSVGDELVLEAAQLDEPPGLISLGPPLARRFHEVVRVADSKLSVLILGESGTGKELVARALHKLSGRTGAFVAVNCGALAPTLVESEFFGYRKGAFTGAEQNRSGIIRSADGGTLFLDEVGDLPLASQVVLLRALQGGEVIPVGGTKPSVVDIRVVAATNRNLHDLEARGLLRSDLMARLRGFVIRLPPLRERREDLGLLVGTLIERLAPERAAKISFSSEAARTILQYEWPLNIRQLEKCLERALILSDGVLTCSDLLPDIEGDGLPVASLPPHPPHPVLSEEDEKLADRLRALFEQHRGNVAAVARELAKAPNQIRRWTKRLRIEPEEYRD